MMGVLYRIKLPTIGLIKPIKEAYATTETSKNKVKLLILETERK
jgi:hypothetical protein